MPRPLSILKKTILILTVSTQLLTPAFAQSTEGPLAAAFRKATSEALADLEKAGVQTLGISGTKDSIAVQALASRLEEVQYIELDSFQKPPGALRNSAFYEPSTKSVYINRSATIPSQALKPLALHETMGALGFKDVDYQASLAASLIAEKFGNPKTFSEKLSRKTLETTIRGFWQLNDSQKMDPRTQNDPDRFLENRREGGGANGVGGGGDGNSLIYKSLLIHVLASDPEMIVPEAYWGTLLNLQLEISSDTAIQNLQYDWVSLGKSGQDLEKILESVEPQYRDRVRNFEKQKKVLRVLVPKSLAVPLIEEGASAENDAALQDISFLIKSLLPSRRGGDIQYSCQLANGMQIMAASYRAKNLYHPQALRLIPEQIHQSEVRYRQCLDSGRIELVK